VSHNQQARRQAREWLRTLSLMLALPALFLLLWLLFALRPTPHCGCEPAPVGLPAITAGH
jgi:hypothetical protein